MRTHDDDPDAVETDPTDALQNALAGEHGAVYAYGFVAGRLEPGSAMQRQATASYAVHLKRRDDLIATLTRDEQTPVEPAPAYETGTVDAAADARRLAQQIESALVGSWLAVVGTTSGVTRTYACDAATDSATALLAWGGDPTALPGTE
ncbi:ferritin-like domain-containing protein [Mumia sp. Pv 4-285]|uniref:ferritin-like domain-containing protein n=1 Tax=Mumia qirimensis TaxID=3234852 RepID=UPI00351D893F